LIDEAEITGNCLAPPFHIKNKKSLPLKGRDFLCEGDYL
jgi:hypothetical protein